MEDIGQPERAILSYYHLVIRYTVRIDLMPNAAYGVCGYLWIGFKHLTNVVNVNARLRTECIYFIMPLAVGSGSQLPVHDVGHFGSLLALEQGKGCVSGIRNPGQGLEPVTVPHHSK
jgi:hypothetical protein